MTATATENMAYVAYCSECGGLVAAIVDDPNHRKGRNGSASEVARWIRDGSRVERVTCQYVRDNLNGCTPECPCKWCVKRRMVKASEQEVLL